MANSERLKGTAELVVYSCHCADHGPEHRMFDEDDIQAAGGICGVEMELRRDSYWFARLGLIEAIPSALGWSFTDDAVIGLVEPAPGEWRLGQRNPSLLCGTLGRQVFESLFRGLSKFLRGWAYEEEGTINAYVIKQINITPST